MIIDEIMVVQKQDMQKHVRTPEITCIGAIRRRRGNQLQVKWGTLRLTTASKARATMPRARKKRNSGGGFPAGENKMLVSHGDDDESFLCQARRGGSASRHRWGSQVNINRVMTQNLTAIFKPRPL
jgi:hypothetical protein